MPIPYEATSVIAYQEILPYDINASGRIVGSQKIAPWGTGGNLGLFNAFSAHYPSKNPTILRSGTLHHRDARTADDRYVTAQGVSNNNDVVILESKENTRTYINQTRFSYPSKWLYAQAMDINSAGDVVGIFGYDEVDMRGFIRRNGKFFEILPPNTRPGDDVYVLASRISEQGDVAGIYLAPGSNRMLGFQVHAGKFYEIDAGLDITIVTGFADSGVMTGFIADYTGISMPALITPSWADTDGDSLPDGWEIKGITTRDGFLNLPAMGADPLRKDIFVEVDYMDAPDHDHAFNEQAAALVVAAFARAPVTNPDGSTGISLHIDTPDAIMNPKTGMPWKELGDGGAIPEDKELGLLKTNAVTGSLSYNWTEFENIKKKHFNAALRGDVFHYAVFAHVLGGKESATSGLGEIQGDDFIVSLGSQPITPYEQDGTFLHELGHNLGLRHSGEASYPNHEPNYFSAMNYSYQFGLVETNDDLRLDYSPFSSSELAPLDEANLDETKGLLSIVDVSDFSLVYYCGDQEVWVNNTASIDWNCNGISTDTDVSSSVNQNLGIERLTTYDDWNNLFFAFNEQSISSGATMNDAPTRYAETETEANELTIEQVKRMIRSYPYSVLIGDIPFLRLAPGDTVEYKFIVENIGKKPGKYNIDSSSSLGWADRSGVPAVIELGPNEKTIVSIRITVPERVYANEVDILKLVASGQHKEIAVGEARTYVADNDSPYLSCGTKLVTLRGTNKDDTLRGTPGDDVIHGLNGNDTIQGLGGNDIICGGNGKDDLDGGAGNDALYGGHGDDTLMGQAGDDKILGDNGDDTLNGGIGHDVCDGGLGANTVRECE